MARLGDRPTRDLIAIYVAGVVGFILIFEVIGIFIVSVIQPGAIDSTVVAALAGTVDLLVGGVVGYMAGRGGSEKGDDSGREL